MITGFAKINNLEHKQVRARIVNERASRKMKKKRAVNNNMTLLGM